MRALVLLAAITVSGCGADISRQPCTERFGNMTMAVPDGELASILMYDITGKPKTYARSLLESGQLKHQTYTDGAPEFEALRDNDPTGEGSLLVSKDGTFFRRIGPSGTSRAIITQACARETDGAILRSIEFAAAAPKDGLRQTYVADEGRYSIRIDVQ